MIEGEQMVAQMRELVGLFLANGADRQTLDELARLMADEDRWSEAHDLFRRIRAKTLLAVKNENHRFGVQYAFEEICAKSLYNMTSCDDPFDPDAPYFVIPFAIRLARELGIADSRVLAIVTKDGFPGKQPW